MCGNPHAGHIILTLNATEKPYKPIAKVTTFEKILKLSTQNKRKPKINTIVHGFYQK